MTQEKNTPPHIKVARIIRKDLKAQGISAKVTSTYTTTGSSVEIRTEDLSPHTLETLRDRCNKYKAGKFNVETECYEYNRNPDLQQIEHIFIVNRTSSALEEKAYLYMKKTFAGLEDLPCSYEEAQDMTLPVEILGFRYVWLIIPLLLSKQEYFDEIVNFNN
jgi:hypothetical protein